MFLFNFIINCLLIFKGKAMFEETNTFEVGSYNHKPFYHRVIYNPGQTKIVYGAEEIGKIKRFKKARVEGNIGEDAEATTNSVIKFLLKKPQLTSVIFRNNHLFFLPRSIGNLYNLMNLEVSNNLLEEVPETICDLINLTKLDFSGNNLQNLPESIGDLINLREMYLCQNKLSSLPNSIGDLKKLRILNLDRNKLRTLPVTIGNLKNLKVLYVYNNQIELLPNSIGNLKKLMVLYLGRNRLIMLPTSIGKLKNLTDLWLSDNQLTVIPKKIGNLKNLKALNLKRNNLESLPETMKKLLNLKELYLDINFSIDQFIGRMWRIRYKNLDLSNKGLQEIPPDIFLLKNLETLNVSCNHMTQITPFVGKLNKLKELIIYCNNLKELPDTLWNLPALEKVEMDSNLVLNVPQNAIIVFDGANNNVINYLFAWKSRFRWSDEDIKRAMGKCVVGWEKSSVEENVESSLVKEQDSSWFKNFRESFLKGVENVISKAKYILS